MVFSSLEIDAFEILMSLWMEIKIFHISRLHDRRESIADGMLIHSFFSEWYAC
jgi:hypothetical protein